MIEQQSFNGTLVHRIQGPILRPGEVDPEPSFHEYYFHEPGQDRFQSCGQLFGTAFWSNALYQNRLARNSTTDLCEQTRVFADKLCRQLSPEDQHILEIIRQSRIRFAFLIDSPGGLGAKVDLVQSCTDFINRNKGEIYAFGGEDVASAAAFIFMQADRGKRFLMRNSELFFHLSACAVGVPAVDNAYVTDEDVDEDVDEDLEHMETEQLKEEQWAKLSDMLIREVREEARQAMRDKLERARSLEDKEPDRPIVFNGEEAAHYGLAELPRSSRRTNQHVKMRTKFEEIFGISRKAYSRTGIDEFFQGIDYRPPFWPAFLDSLPPV